MTYKPYIYTSDGRRWRGTLSEDGWARFYAGPCPFLAEYHVALAAACATQEQAEAYVKAKVISLARGEPKNKYIPLQEPEG